ncbi:MAG TPA: ZIP family metal transporter [Capillimicrobium sp.]|nr:ZIP family metal transporter [Capillimicrobium sp.]
MLEALLWGLVGSSSLVIGATIGARAGLADRWLGLLLGFGCGALISAISFELAEDALGEGGPAALAAGLALGALTFYVGDRLVERGTGTPRRERGPDNGTALALGALLDGLPEQAAIGLSIAAGGEVGIALVAAVFLSNVPEALGSAADMRAAGMPRRRILRLWLAVGSVTTVASIGGYEVLGASGPLTGTVQAFAAGALLVMLIDALAPEALRKGGRVAGLATVLGYALSVLLSQVVS